MYLDENFLSENEEAYLLEEIDKIPWDSSQSGRRKQNFGPKCNFRKKKLKLGNFEGFPIFAKFLQEKFTKVPLLHNYITIEQCSLEYDPKRGACIDPHIDDCWIWGERIVTVNLLADSVLTMTFNEKLDKYNLDCVDTYPAVLNKDGTLNKTDTPFVFNSNKSGSVIRIPMPRRSLLVLFNSARYEWEHQILREDIAKRRVCLAFREFTPTYLEDGKDYMNGKDVLEKAKCFL